MQRQLRLGDILDDYCPRERRLTNHAVVAMVGDDVKRTRCTTCDAEHEYKHARVPRQRKKDTPAGLQAQILASGPKRPVPEPVKPAGRAVDDTAAQADELRVASAEPAPQTSGQRRDDDDIARVAAALGLGGRIGGRSSDALYRESAAPPDDEDATLGPETDGHQPGQPEGPAHRRLIRATLPRLEGQQPAARPAPEFTIRTPNTGRPNRFRPRQNQRAAQQPFGGARPTQGGHAGRQGGPRHGNANAGGNRQPQANQSRRFDTRNNKRSK